MSPVAYLLPQKYIVPKIPQHLVFRKRRLHTLPDMHPHSYVALMKQCIKSSIILFILIGTTHASAQSLWMPEYDKFTLANDLDVILHRDTTVSLVSVHMAYRAGSSFDPAGKTGTARIAWELLLQGSKEVPRSDVLAFRDEYNATIQAHTSVDWVAVSSTMPMNLLEAAIMIEANRMRYADEAVKAETVDAVKEALRNVHLERRQSELGTLTQQIYNETYAERHPYRHMTIGMLEHLDSIGVNDVRAFIRRYYVPANASLTISGNFDAMQARTLVERYFSTIPSGQVVRWGGIDDSYSPIGMGGFIREDNIAFNRIILVFPTVRTTHTDEPVLRLLASLLTGSPDALLNRVLLNENPLVRSVEASQSSQELTGTFWITVTCNMDVQLQPIYEQLRRALESMANETIPDYDLIAAKNSAAMNFYTPLEQFDGFSGRSAMLNIGNLLTTDPLFTFNQFTAMQNVSGSVLSRIASRYLDSENQLVVSVVPFRKSSQAVTF